MTTFGYFLASEECQPDQLLEQARLAQEAGFTALAVSDHFHPWVGEQGSSPFQESSGFVDRTLARRLVGGPCQGLFRRLGAVFAGRGSGERARPSRTEPTTESESDERDFS